jgi:valyl-tRNA synthetase
MVQMSKSLGNVIDPRDIIEGGKNRKTDPPYGALIAAHYTCCTAAELFTACGRCGCIKAMGVIGGLQR